MHKRLPTIRDVAKHAGVSLTTTSYILNKKPRHKFAQETVSKIETAVESLDLNSHAVGRYAIESLINIIEGIKTPEEYRTQIPVKLIRRIP